ncbi:MJ1255/VC2487 family glycosyltransferase [Planctobacterium marinum]|uniref:MJ1255/VC2487 family glycosyltransferase n=1 Tax=Planctobacterium marinum TaxID=1631968 RepID=UPI001E5A6E2C|nr:MJ1255/VC2487 family glycosyltransferase [Planctobacterium marinum]MCC2607051.1 glycosyltransferase [Planctobacterium marinum]
MTLKILYGVQGTGNGHTTRARVMAKAFEERRDVEVDFLFSGRAKEKYFDMEVFGDFQTRKGLTFIHSEGSVNPFKTVTQARPIQLWKDVKALDLSGYDLVLNDFEPVSAWAAKQQKVPSISISHQAAFAHDVPKAGQSVIDRLIMNNFAPTQMSLGVHWYHFGHAIMPPFIEDQLSDVTIGSHYLVYLPFESLEEISTLLESLSEYNFMCFHPDVEQERDEGHISWCKTSKAGFHKALHSCAGVIANGGFELSSECLQLGKKLLIKPLHGQFEQLSNAKTLDALGLCQIMMSLDQEKLEQWLDLPPGEAIEFPSDPCALIDWLVKGEWQDTASVVKALWQQVKFPDNVQRKLDSMVKA